MLLDMKKQNVSSQLVRLKDEGLVEIKRRTRRGRVYKKRRVDRILGISRMVRRKFEIG